MINKMNEKYNEKSTMLFFMDHWTFEQQFIFYHLPKLFIFYLLRFSPRRGREMSDEREWPLFTRQTMESVRLLGESESQLHPPPPLPSLYPTSYIQITRQALNIIISSHLIQMNILATYKIKRFTNSVTMTWFVLHAICKTVGLL